jgi:hypothetical protein
VRLVASYGSSLALLTATLVEALRARGYRTASVEQRPGGAGLAVTLPSGGRIGVERAVEAAELGAFVAGLDPRADLVLALGFEDGAGRATPAIELTSEAAPVTTADVLLATVEEAELTASLQSAGGSAAIEELAALLDARLLGGDGSDEAPSGGGLLGRLRGLGRRG